MRELYVYIEMYGKQTLVGTLVAEGRSNAIFRYNKEYISSANAMPISINLPLYQEEFDADTTKAFFEGLLPEGVTRRAVAANLHVDVEDYIAILERLGKECLGAIMITKEPVSELTGKYELLDLDVVKQLAKEGVTKSAELLTKTHLSLTGASGKVGLYYDEINFAWYLPHGVAPSTHIVKQSHVRLNDIVLNEQLSLETARKLGISVPESFIINTANKKDEEILFASKRYDRKNDSAQNGEYPIRLHQEDFAQAMGILAADKYEKTNDHYVEAMFQLLRKKSANPIEDQVKLWDIILFDFLIGNTDNHIKNYSLLYSEDLKSIRLAPAYDIISTTVYEQSTRDMAFKLGGVYSIDEIGRETLATQAGKCGLGEKMAMQRFDKMLAHFENALIESAKEIYENGYKNVIDIKNAILKTGGYGKLQ